MFVAASTKVPTTVVVDSTRAQANARARFLARHYGVSFFVVDYTAPDLDPEFWREFGWYCQHSYQFCAPCFAGYDHPADEASDHRDDYYVAEDGTWMLYEVTGGEAVPSPADLLN